MKNVEEYQELINWVTLSMARRLDTAMAVNALRVFGGPKEMLEAPLQDLSRLVGIQAAEEIRALARGSAEEQVEEVKTWLEGHDDAYVLPITHPFFPARLVGVGRAPLVLYARGALELLRARSVAVCGATAPNATGERNAFEFGEGLSASGDAVVTLLERGIAAATIAGVLSACKRKCEASPPVLFLATGPARAPRDYAELQRSVLEAKGLLISAEPVKKGLDEASRRRRDELFAAFAERLLLVQAAQQDPALLIARDAVECGVFVGAVPGDIHDPLSRGGNRLIREGAALIETCADIGF